MRPIALEIAVCGGLFLAYRAGRSISRDAADEALRNAADVVHVERTLGIFHEQAVQRLALHSHTLVELLNRYYVSVHFPATIVFLVWAYLRHIHAYRLIRTWFAGVTLLALGLHVIYPLAPPRMTEGFVDTLRVFGPRIYSPDTSRSVANQFAAMPSLHFGWALMLAVSVVVIKQSRISLLALVHPVVTLFAIVATGNHYWLDAIVVTVLAAVVGAVVLTHRSRAAEMLPVSAVSAVAVSSAPRSASSSATASSSSATTSVPAVPTATATAAAVATGGRPRCHRRPACGSSTPMADSRERAPIGRGASLTDPSHAPPTEAVPSGRSG